MGIGDAGGAEGLDAKPVQGAPAFPDLCVRQAVTDSIIHDFEAVTKLA